MKQANLCFLLKGNQVLLAMKKRGFGVGKWNGVGGKKKEDETIEESLIREVKEEIGVDIDINDLFNHGDLEFIFEGKPDWDQTVTVFSTKRWQGEPVESEEMKPQWFDSDDIPYENMWKDDPHWLPLVLEGKKFSGKFTFSEEGNEIIDNDVKVISN